MNCEEFASIGLGAEHDGEISAVSRGAARAHLESCADCAALAESWGAARAKLQLLADATNAQGAPARVEMRLRQEFRTRHRTMRTRRAALVASWGLAAAAVLVVAISWVNWRAHHVAPVGLRDVAQKSQNQTYPSTDAKNDDSLVADNEEDGFTALPGAMYTGNNDATIVRVGMQRGELGALGLPVNEDRAGEWIQVDLLVGDDGLPQAVRAPQ
jgi:anti-sigma factor RsiW